MNRLIALPLRHGWTWSSSLNISVARFSVSTASRTLPTVTLYSKTDDCSLCEDMVEAFQPYMNKIKFEVVDISQDENKYWKSRYKYEIPVVHFNGKLLMKHRFDEEKLTQALDKHYSSSSA